MPHQLLSQEISRNPVIAHAPLVRLKIARLRMPGKVAPRSPSEQETRIGATGALIDPNGVNAVVPSQGEIEKAPAPVHARMIGERERGRSRVQTWEAGLTHQPGVREETAAPHARKPTRGKVRDPPRRIGFESGRGHDLDHAFIHEIVTGAARHGDGTDATAAGLKIAIAITTVIGHDAETVLDPVHELYGTNQTAAALGADLLGEVALAIETEIASEISIGIRPPGLNPHRSALL